jgi:hypothetical protein
MATMHENPQRHNQVIIGNISFFYQEAYFLSGTVNRAKTWN